MNQETVTWHSLGEIDPELAEKITADIERVVQEHINYHLTMIGTRIVSEQQSNIERMALNALKKHFNSAPNIW